MKKFLMIIMVIGLFFLMGCGATVRNNINPEKMKNVLSKKENKSFFYLTYNYKDQPNGLRAYGLLYTYASEKKDYYVYFDNKDKKDIVLIDIKPGDYFIKSVTYQGQMNGRTYGQYPIYTNISIGSDTIYYLGSFDIFRTYTNGAELFGSNNSNKSKMGQYLQYYYNPSTTMGVNASAPIYHSGGTTASVGVGFGIDIDGMAAAPNQFDGLLTNRFSEDTNFLFEKYKDLNGINITSLTLKAAYTN
jgi:hypothetical protein